MTNEQLGARRDTYFSLNTEIAAMSNAEIRALLSEGETNPGWGTHQTVDVGGTNVFVKSVPVTELEYANAFSTRNLYDMPLYYNYGVGSAGFAAAGCGMIAAAGLGVSVVSIASLAYARQPPIRPTSSLASFHGMSLSSPSRR